MTAVARQMPATIILIERSTLSIDLVYCGPGRTFFLMPLPNAADTPRLPWNAAALPEIMAGAVQEGKRGVQGSGQTGEQQASSRVASPERERVKRQKPNRGLTPRLTANNAEHYCPR